MAAGSLVKELCEEATCSICRDYFKDPVTIADCGHNFCRACLTQSWGETGAEAFCCPQCRGATQPGSLRPDEKVANIVKIAKTLQKRKEGELKRAEGKEGVCKKCQEPLISCSEDEAPICVGCSRAKRHKDNQATTPEAASQENQAVSVVGKARACEEHQKPLMLFCNDDETLICVDCKGSQEHADHNVIPLEEAAQEFKAGITGFLEVLRKEKINLLQLEGPIVKESEDLLMQLEENKEKTIGGFRKLHGLLEMQKQHEQDKIKEVKKEIARRKDEFLANHSEEICSLESLIQEMKEKIKQPPSELLQDFRSTQQSSEFWIQCFEGKKKKFETPVVFPTELKWQIWEFGDIGRFLNSVMKQFEDTKLQLQKANVTLDPDTAHPKLLVCEDGKSIRVREKPQVLPDNPERFSDSFCVLGCEGFTRGRHFWDIVLGCEGEWAVGVARKSLKRKGSFTVGPKVGIWAVGREGSEYVSFCERRTYWFKVKEKLRRIRVALNCEGGQVSFFDPDTAAHLCTYSGADISGETLQPFFLVKGKAQLQLYP